jgi:DNA repair exonuclease SbcCD nuclease subunit
MAITFLHAADIHLDSPLKGLERYENAPVERIRNATRRAFTRLIDLAIDRRVDFVLLAGDLYDGHWPDYNTGLFLVNQLNRLKERKIPVVMIAGNHDAHNRITRTLRLPENVNLLSHERPQTIRFDDLDVAIHGQSFAKAAVTDNLAAGYPPAVGGFVNIGLLHTALAGAEGHEPYAPCTIEELRLRRYDYWALGHIHLRQVVHDDPPIIFPGNVQGRHIRETGPKGCIVVTIEPNRKVTHEFHRLDVVRWERANIDVSGAETEAELFECVSGALDDLLAVEPERLQAVRITLFGASSLHARLQTATERFEAEVRALATARGDDRIWIERVHVATSSRSEPVIPEGPFEELRVVLAQLRDDPAAMAPIIAELAELERKLPDELIQDADAPRLDDRAWLQSLLGQVEPLLLDLLHKSTSADPR